MIYTLQNGYDKQLKKRIEKAAAYTIPLAVLAIVGIASLTNNITHIINRPSPSGGTSQAANSGKTGSDPSVAGSWTNTAANQKSASSTSTGMTSARATQSKGLSSTAQHTVSGGDSTTLPIIGGRGGGEESSTTTPTSPLPVNTAPVTSPVPSTPIVVTPPSSDCGCSDSSTGSGGGNTSQPIDLGVSVGGLGAGVSVDTGGLVGGLGL